jgi:hypothetical protein
VAAMKTLISVYTAVIGTIKLKGDRRLKKWLNDVEANHPSLSYFVKKRIITDNLYGVDIMEEATEIAKLRLFLDILTLCAIWNSFVYDSLLRLKVSANINYFFVYSTQVPQIKTGTRYFNEIVERAQGFKPLSDS